MKPQQLARAAVQRRFRRASATVRDNLRLAAGVGRLGGDESRGRSRAQVSRDWADCARRRDPAGFNSVDWGAALAKAIGNRAFAGMVMVGQRRLMRVPAICDMGQDRKVAYDTDLQRPVTATPEARAARVPRLVPARRGPRPHPSRPRPPQPRPRLALRPGHRRPRPPPVAWRWRARPPTSSTSPSTAPTSSPYGPLDRARAAGSG
jgi:hypothetical protein